MKAGCVNIESLFRFPLLWLLAPALVFGADDFGTAQFQKSSTPLSTAEASQVDASVRTVMERNGIPAISLAIVRNDQIAYAKAYGRAELPNPEASNRDRLVSTATRFAIGSVSKEFTAAAMLLLADRGKLSLDDPVSRFLPKLTGAAQVTIRELLNHTAGYRDYFLEEYIPARMQRATTVDSILKEWAERPLDFIPGTQWQYSGTNYVIAGRIMRRSRVKRTGNF
jgi:D-alanyl-D-alanine carboxypeptidase